MDTNQNDDQSDDQSKVDKNRAIEEGVSTNTKNCNDQVENDKKTGIDLNEDLSKKKKLNKLMPSVSTSDNVQDPSPKSSFNFRKVQSKVTKRNYRSQSNSSEQSNSDSSISLDFQQQNRVFLSDSSDQSEEYGDVDIDEISDILKKEPSKSDWSIVKDVTNRQIGFNNSVPSRFYSSLHAVQRLELMYKFGKHITSSLDFNQKGNLLASSSNPRKVYIWDWAAGKKLVTLKTGHKIGCARVKWLPLDLESFIVTCAQDGQVRVLDIRSGLHYKVAQHHGGCRQVSTHINLPHIILSACRDSEIFSIDVRQKKPTKLLSVKEHNQKIGLYSIHSHPLIDFEFCVAGENRFVRIYDRRKTSASVQKLCPKHLLPVDVSISCAVYNHNGTEILATYNNDDIYLFDTSSSRQLGDFAHRYPGRRSSNTFATVDFFGPYSKFVLSGSECGNIFIWDKKTEAIVQWMSGDELGFVSQVKPHPHIPVLATSGLDHNVKIWIPSRQETPNINKQELGFRIKRNLALLRGFIKNKNYEYSDKDNSDEDTSDDGDNDEENDDNDSKVIYRNCFGTHSFYFRSSSSDFSSE